MSFFGDVLKTAAPIAAGYFTGGAATPFLGMTGATAGMAAGALTGAGIAALSGDDVLMGGVSGGLGGYSGGGLGSAANAAGSQAAIKAGTSNATMNAGKSMFGGQAGVSQAIPVTNAATGAGINSLNPTVAGGTGPNMGFAAKPDASFTESISDTFSFDPKAASDGISQANKGLTENFRGTMEEYGGGLTSADGTPNPNAFYKGVGKTAMGTGLPLLAAATQPEPAPGYSDNPMNKYDPTRTLNLSMDTGIDDALRKDSGLRLLAQGGYLNGGNVGDGMSDDISATIDGTQEAALSQGEFVVPADVVSHLGNGSSEAGSKQLYKMMDEVRRARTGNKKQGKEINPERYMPA
jgi:hypothetical protein